MAANIVYKSAIRIVTLFAQDRECIGADGDSANALLRVHELVKQTRRPGAA